MRLFARWRHPNCLGEILLQVGLITTGLASVSNWIQSVAVLLSTLYIVILMVSEARCVGAVQLERYGSDPKYKAYRQRSGSLLPPVSF